MSDFQLHTRLAADTHPVCSLATSDVLLMDDSRFPWLILVPRIADARELHRLDDKARHAVYDEINHCTQVLETLVNPHKMNVAALGNLVEQLHVHVIARFIEDPAWPAPVWGHSEPVAYRAEALDAFVTRLRSLLDR